MNTEAGPEPGTGETVRGVLLILAAGIVLGVAWNALHLASRPPGGLPWIARPTAVAKLESLQPPPGAPRPADTLATPAPEPPSASSAPPRAVGKPGTPSARADAPAARATASRDTAGHPTAAPRPATPPPAAPESAPPPAVATREPASPPPVIPDVPGPLTLELPALKQLYDANAALVVDAREPSQYAAGHIAGAVSLPYNGALAEPDRIAALEPARRPIVVYCSGGTCELAMDLAKFLVESGKRRVLVYPGGYPEWEAAGYPVARGMTEGARP